MARITLLFSIFILLSSSTLMAQYETVLFDYERNYFNQGQPLPAESYFILSGQIDTDIELVEALVFRAQKKDEKPLYQASWKRRFNNREGETFEIPMNYKLRGNNSYNLHFKTYKRSNNQEKDRLFENITTSLNNYVDGVIAVDKKRLDITQPAGSMIQDLNDIVSQGTTLYRNKINYDFPGFSDIIKNKIKQLNQAKLSKAWIVFGDRNQKKYDAQKKYAEQLISELKNALYTELKPMLNAELLVLVDSKEVEDYPVEKTRNIISINAGYGGVHFAGGLNNLTYDSGFYLGLSIPLANSALSNPFLSNTSISLGAFIKNMQDENEIEVTGPIFRRPYFVGLGYKAFQFVRINAGVTVIEAKRETFQFNINEVRVRPFVGISAELNLWLGLGRKNNN